MNFLVVFICGYVFVGVWFKLEEFLIIVVDDVMVLCKWFKLKELVFFEMILVMQCFLVFFSWVVEVGVEQVVESKDDMFELVVDICCVCLQCVKLLFSLEFVQYKELMDIVVDDKVYLEDVFDFFEDDICEMDEVVFDFKDCFV